MKNKSKAKKQQTPAQRIIRCAVAAINSGGEPDLYFVKVKATEEQVSSGVHYQAAKEAAEEDGYEAFLAYDEDDYAGGQMMELFDWETASIVEI